jgi:hypothetical protein
MTTTTATGPSKPGQLPDRWQDESVRQRDDRHSRSFCFSIALLAFSRTGTTTEISSHTVLHKHPLITP